MDTETNTQTNTQMNTQMERKKYITALTKMAVDYETKRNIYWESFRSLRFRGHCLSIPLLFITSFTGATSCIQVTDLNNNIKGLSIIISVFGVSSAILTALQKYMRFTERSEQSKYISKMYGLVASKIKGQIQLLVAGHTLFSGEDYNKFLDEINKEVQSLQLEIDIVPKALMAYDTTTDESVKEIFDVYEIHYPYSVTNNIMNDGETSMNVVVSK